jgi:hypothetical protein
MLEYDMTAFFVLQVVCSLANVLLLCYRRSGMMPLVGMSSTAVDGRVTFPSVGGFDSGE